MPRENGMTSADPNVHHLKQTPPYVGFDTVYDLLNNYGRAGLPSEIDYQEIKGFSAVVASQIVTALKFLGLIDNLSRPTKLMKDVINTIGREEWSVRWNEIVRSAYYKLFNQDHDLETMTAGDFTLKFGKLYPVALDVQRKARAFFLRAAEEANIPLSSELHRSIKRRLRRRQSASLELSRDFSPSSGPASEKFSSALINKLDFRTMSEKDQDHVMAVVRILKRQGL